MKRRKDSLRLIVSLIAMMLIISACKKDSDDTPQPSTPPPGGSSGTAVTIQGMAFSPSSLTVTTGTTVTWTNRDNVAHTVTADDNSFSSPLINNGGTYSRTFNTAGTFPYHCTPHPEMRATITVQ
ncbi:MAG TPA: plastocyanin/azurin family copper-binding protein [Sphingobacteriaceae bacterium]